MVVWVEMDCYLSSRGWMPARCYVATVTETTAGNGVTLTEPNGTWHRTWQDRVKVVHIEKEATPA